MNIKAILLSIVLLPSFSFSQETEEPTLNRTSLSLDIGFPNIAGLNGEYLLPYASNRFSIYADLSYLPNLVPYSTTYIKYYGIGSHYYFNKKGNGAYIGLGYGKLPISTSELDGDEVDLSVDFDFLNTKIGAKLGKKLFFKIEAGYSMIFYDIDKANEYLTEAYGIQINPKISFLQLMNARIGFGYSF